MTIASKRKQEWKIGDYFTVQLSDKSFSIGQVVARDPLTLKNAPICAFFRYRLKDIPQQIEQHKDDAELVAILFVTRNHLDSGDWKVFSAGNPLSPKEYFPDIEDRREKGFVGTKIIGSAIVMKLLDAYFGLYPWDGFFEPDYLDKLLVSPDRKPEKVMLKNTIA
jgi:hypothetical protein